MSDIVNAIGEGEAAKEIGIYLNRHPKTKIKIYVISLTIKPALKDPGKDRVMTMFTHRK